MMLDGEGSTSANVLVTCSPYDKARDVCKACMKACMTWKNTCVCLYPSTWLLSDVGIRKTRH